MAEYLSIREAAQVTGMSVTTLRRLVRHIAADDQHPDRVHLLPTPDDVHRLRDAGEQFPWEFSAEFLKTQFGGKSTRPRNKPVDSAEPLGELVSLLRDQLEHSRDQLKVKDRQISSQSEIIHSLNERIHEGNVLMATVQKQLALAESSPEKPTTVKASPEKQSAPKRPSRKGLFARLFR